MPGKSSPYKSLKVFNLISTGCPAINIEVSLTAVGGDLGGQLLTKIFQVPLCAGFRAALFQSQFLYPIPQRTKTYPEYFCRRRLVIASVFERAYDRVALNILKMIAEWSATWGIGRH